MAVRTALDAYRHLPAPVRRQVRRRVRTALTRFGPTRSVLRRARTVRPAEVLSVVLPVYNVESYLTECLDSILSQSFRQLQVVVVDDGSPDRSYAIAARYARRDPRVVVVRQLNAGLGAARNTGVRHATGQFLTFVDSDDRLPAGALATMMTSLRRSGADLVVGSVVRFEDSGRRWVPEWTHRLHDRERYGITVDDLPGLVRNNYTWGKVFRRSWWDQQALHFREGVSYEDQPVITELFGRARAIDVLGSVVYEYRSREDGTSISQQVANQKDLLDRVTAWRLSRDRLRGSVSTAVFQAWQLTLFDAHFHWYLNSPSTVDPDYWRVLRAAVVELTADAAPAVWDATAPHRRVTLELALRDRPDLIREFRRDRGYDLKLFASRPTADGILLELPLFGNPDVGLPERLFLLHHDQLELSHSLQRIRWVPPVDEGPLVLELVGWAYVRYLDLSAGDPPTIRLHVCDESGRRSTVVANDTSVVPPMPPPNDDANATYGQGHFCFRVDVTALLAQGRRSGALWSLELEVSSRGYTLSAPLTRVNRRGSGGVLAPHVLPDGSLLVLLWEERRPLLVRYDELPYAVTDVEIDGRRVSGTVVGALDDAVALRATAVGEAAGVATVVTTPLVTSPWVLTGSDADSAADGGPGAAGTSTGQTVGDRGRFVLELPEVEAAPSSWGAAEAVRWRVRVLDSTGRRLQAAWRPESARPRRTAEARGATLSVAPTQHARFGLVERQVEIRAEEVRVDGTVVRVAGRLTGLGHEPLRFRWRTTKVSSAEAVAEVDGDSFLVEVPLHREQWRFGDRPLPVANYRLVGRGDDPAEVIPVVWSPAELADLPRPLGIDDPATLVRATGHAVELQIHRPIGPGARGRYQQQRLRAATYPPRHGVSGAGGVLLSSYFGETATDNGLGLHAELLRRGVDLPIYWAVRDHSVTVPEGGIPVVRDSTEWYRVMSEVGYYLDNMYQPIYHDKPADQVIIQTFHGYPFKTMGYPNWIRAGFPQSRIDSYATRSAQWDYLVSPAPYATPLLCRDFRYDGEVLEIGYPRNDVLVSPAAAGLRTTVRASLGIAADQTAVLYAPTFRDYLSPDDHRAKMVDFLDLDAVTAALGPSYVVLVRGHAFNARVSERVAARPGVVDVTDYPEVSDLYLAADAAIVDYSSLRFDFGVTGKPMIFHVPDLERYVETRGWLFDFEPTAPGPLVATNDEIIDALQRLPEVRREYADAYATFTKDFLVLEDGQASARLVDAVFVPRGDAPPRDPQRSGP